MGHFCFTSMLENPGKFWKNQGKIREFDSGNPVGTLFVGQYAEYIFNQDPKVRKKTQAIRDVSLTTGGGGLPF